MNFTSCQNYWGGGQNDMFAPQYFHWRGDCPPPPPPQDRRLCLQNINVEYYLITHQQFRSIGLLLCPFNAIQTLYFWKKLFRPIRKDNN